MPWWEHPLDHTHFPWLALPCLNHCTSHNRQLDLDFPKCHARAQKGQVSDLPLISHLWKLQVRHRSQLRRSTRSNPTHLAFSHAIHGHRSERCDLDCRGPSCKHYFSVCFRLSPRGTLWYFSTWPLRQLLSNWGRLGYDLSKLRDSDVLDRSSAPHVETSTLVSTPH